MGIQSKNQNCLNRCTALNSKQNKKDFIKPIDASLSSNGKKILLISMASSNGQLDQNNLITTNHSISYQEKKRWQKWKELQMLFSVTL